MSTKNVCPKINYAVVPAVATLKTISVQQTIKVDLQRQSYCAEVTISKVMPAMSADIAAAAAAVYWQKTGRV